MGEASYMEILESACGKEKVDKALIPLDKYVEKWPENLVGSDCMVSQASLNFVACSNINYELALLD